MNTHRIRQALVGLLLLSAAACGKIGTGSQYEPGPVGTGTSVQELKGTPCACVEIPMAIPADGAWAYGA
jgi:hypothetical protein